MKYQLKNGWCLLLTVIALSASAQVPLAEDPVRISPQYYTVRFENDQVRVLEYRLRPGEEEPMHSHSPGVVFVMSDATFLTTLPDGSTIEGSVSNGDVQWRDFTRHAVINIGTTDALAFAVEIKDNAGRQ